MNWILGLVIDNTCVGKQRRKEDFTKMKGMNRELNA